MEWQPIVANFALMFISVLGVVLTGLATLAVKALVKKYNLQNEAEIQDQVDTLIEKGVHATEEWAQKQAVKPTGNVKMDYAIGVIKSLSQNPAIKSYTDEQLKKLTEAILSKLINSKTE